METIKAVIKRIIFSNEESGFKVLSAKTPSGPVLKITGEFGPEIVGGTVADFHGDFKSHAKYGTNFKATSYNISHNAQELTSVKLFIDAIAPNFGPERAQAVVSYFGNETINILNDEPYRLLEVEGIGDKLAEDLKVAWKENQKKWQEERQEYTLRAFLNSLGIRERRVKKILRFFGGGLKAEESVRENPYKLTEIDGFGFSTADYVAKQLGVLESDPLRLQAFIYYAINILSSRNGHLFLTVENCVEMINKYCMESNTYFLGKRTIIDNDLEEPLANLKKEKLIIVEEGCIYSVKNFNAEAQSASKIVSILRKESDLILLTRDSVAEHIANFERENRLTLSDEQRDALYYFVEKKVFAITGSPGTGKCLGYNTPVLMFNGEIKAVQYIKKGDLLMGDDSSPRTVLSISRGEEEMFRVTPKKGVPYEVNRAHILSLKNCYGYNGSKRRLIDISVKDYLNKSNKFKKQSHGYKPMLPLTFKSAYIPKYSPYLLGLWIADGRKERSSFSVNKKDIEIISFLFTEAKKIKGKISISNEQKNSSDYSIIFNKGYNPIIRYLKQLKVFRNKHIPYKWKIMTIKNRLDFLAGYIDGDGSLLKGNKYCYSAESSKKNILDGIEFICRSLGFSVSRNKRIKFLKKTKKYYTSYSIIIGGDIEKIPIKLKRKKIENITHKHDWNITGINIESIEKGNYFGFEIDGNGRFLLGDFTVTHNTTVLKAVVDLIKKLQLDLTCMTPTGISAKKMAQTVGYHAYTIHRRLGFQGFEWRFGELEKYETDVVIIDEASMIDQEVFYRLLCALRKRVHLIFVGDNNQLPSVGAGNVLKELITCGEIPVINLEKIFRQDEASDIIKVAHKIKKGETDLSLFKSDPTADVFFIREVNVEIIEEFVIKLAQKFKDERRLFQIITPRRDGPLSVEVLNQNLQNVLNTPSQDKKEINCGKFILRKGDRIIVIKNDYENDIFNGEVGKIIGISSEKIEIKIDERFISIPIEDIINKIQLAYSLTVHKSQGQEYPYIILPFINQFGRNMLQRNLLYTAITRAKTKVIIIGHGSALEKAIDNASVQRRNTNLGERIRKCLQKAKSDFMPIQHGELADFLPALKEEEPPSSPEGPFRLQDITENL